MIKLNFSSEFLCFCSQFVIIIIDGGGCSRCGRLAVVGVTELAVVELQFLEEECFLELVHVLGDEAHVHLGKRLPDLEAKVEEGVSGGAT